MNTNADVTTIASCLKSGGIVLVPTDTVYGLAALPTCEAAVDRVYSLKRRPRHMNLPIMVDSRERLYEIGIDISDTAQRLFESPLIPGGVTLALGFSGADVPHWLEGRYEVAVRIPNDERLLEVLRLTGPLLVTSANRHGIAPPETLKDALAQLDGIPDIVIDGGSLSCDASTLVNCRVSPPVIEREGVVSKARIMEYLS